MNPDLQLAGLTRLVSPPVRERDAEIFATQDTTFDQLKGAASLREGKVRAEDVVAAAAGYMARGKGWFALDGAAEARGVLSLSKRVSDDIVTDVRESKDLLNDQGRLEVPFTLAGAWPRVRPKPDPEYVARVLVQRGALRKGQEEMEKALRKRWPATGGGARGEGTGGEAPQRVGTPVGPIKKPTLPRGS